MHRLGSPEKIQSVRRKKVQISNRLWKTGYVYVDDILVFSKNEVDHGQNLEKVFSTLQNANMRVQVEKCHFFKNEVDFLGYTISENKV